MAKLSKTDENARLAERKRVDDFVAKKLAERNVSTKQGEEFDYPLSVALFGQGWRNLYDSLRGQQHRYSNKEKR